jgi:hypothetical protein
MSETEIPVTPNAVTFIHHGQKDIKTVKIGFDWPAFFSPFIFGIPHLIRKLWVIGGILFVMNLLSFFITPAGASEEDMMVIAVLALAFDIGLGIWLGKNGRAHHAKSLLAQGYEFAHAEHEATKAAKLKWGIL